VTRSLRVDADLVLEHDGDRVDVWTEDGGDGSIVVVNAPSLAAMRALRGTLATLPETPETAGRRLAAVDLTVEVRVRHARVARVGGGVRGGPVATRLAGDAAAVDWSGVATAVVRRFL